MSDIDDMALFCRIADLGSLSAAGRELRVSTALASHRLAKLEDYHGVTLLNRTTRKVALTEEGRLFYQYCQQVLAATGDFEDHIARHRDDIAGPIALNAPGLMGRELVAPLVASFVKEYPNVSVQLSLSDDFVDPVSGGFDLVLRCGTLSDSAMLARHIGKESRSLVAAPDYLTQHQAPTRVTDLGDHACLLLRFPGSQQFRWTFLRGANSETIAPAGHMESDDHAVLLSWALSGAGLALMPDWLIAPHIESGQLVRISLDASPKSVDVSLLWPPNRFQPPRFRALAAWLVDGIAPELRYVLH